MRRWMFGLAVGAFLASGALAAEREGMMRHGMMGMLERFSPEDLDAFTDARIAAFHAGLKLSPDQEKMWPPAEEAMRGLVRLRRDQVRAWRESRGQARDDIPGLLRAMADRQSTRADALRKLADAAAPLYASLDEGQKRRLRMLARMMRPHFGGMHHAMRDRGDRPPVDE
jgi:zinc resistance-associated protein